METKRVGVLTSKPSLLNFDPRLNFNKTEFSTELHRTRISANDGWYFRLSITCALVLNLVLVNFITWHQKYKIKTYNVVCLKARTILVVDNNNKKKNFLLSHDYQQYYQRRALFDLTTEIWKPLSVVHLCCVFHFCILPTGPKASSALVNTSIGGGFISTYFLKQAWCTGRLLGLSLRKLSKYLCLLWTGIFFLLFRKQQKILWSNLMLRTKKYF